MKKQPDQTAADPAREPTLEDMITVAVFCAYLIGGHQPSTASLATLAGGCRKAARALLASSSDQPG